MHGNSVYNRVSPSKIYPKILDLLYKTDLGFQDCIGKENPSWSKFLKTHLDIWAIPERGKTCFIANQIMNFNPYHL